MTVIKQYNAGTSQWEAIVVGKQGPQGPTGPTGPTGATGPSGSGEVLFTISGTLLQGIGQARWYAPRALTISNIQASVATAPVGQSIIFDVNSNGTSLFTTNSKPTIAAGTNEDLSTVPNTTSISQGAYLTVDVDQIGTTTAGADAVIQISFT